MGKARILSAQGEGRYSIEILEDRTRAESLKQRAQQRISAINSELSSLNSELQQARQALQAAIAEQDQAIEDRRAGDDSIDLQAASQAVLTAAAARDTLRSRIASLELERLQQQGWIDRVDALPPLRTQDAWCADFTEDLEGEVATAEVPGEIGQVIIKPGYEGANQWSASEDGAMQPALASTPAGVFYNLAMMPGWQRWRPTFRIATISNINNDLCDITLDTATSSQQGLNVNAKESYSGVPIYYMDCNGAAFEEGDRVLVAFSGNTDEPMVVGFESEPRECNIVYILREQRIRIIFRSSIGRLTSDYSGYPPPPFAYDRDIAANSIRMHVNDTSFIGTPRYYSYSRPERIEGVEAKPSLEDARQYLEESAGRYMEDVSELDYEPDREVGYVDLPLTEQQYRRKDGSTGTAELSMYGLTRFTPGFVDKRWNVHWDYAVSNESVSVSFSDSNSVDRGMFGVDGKAEMRLSNEITEELDVTVTAEINSSDMPSSLETGEERYVFNRFLMFKHASDPNTVNALFVEYIREDYLEE